MYHSSSRASQLLGYSWKTNQYGLALDNVVKFELVLPDSKAVSVTEDDHSDLFWALKVCTFDD